MTRTVALLVAVLLVALPIRPVRAQSGPPAWSVGAVWYQIFPERFRNGDPGNDPTAADLGNPPGWRPSPWTSNWYALQPWEAAAGGGFYRHVFDRRYGGDLQGVLDKLPYLDSLGVTAIYLNPVFEAESLHKYDASTFHHIDDSFGPDRDGDAARMAAERTPDDPATWRWTAADSLLLKLVAATHRRGMKLVLDAVFNHTGQRFWAYQDVKAKGAASRYADWYDVTRFDDPATPDNEFEVHGWWGNRGLPEFREDSTAGFPPALRAYLFAITRRWMDPNGDGDPSDGIDGWRLDVANEVSPAFWRAWRKHVKAINPNAIIIGELWGDAGPWLRGDMFDSVMNYPFAMPTVAAFANRRNPVPITTFDRQLRLLREAYPAATTGALMNLLDSHDTDRLPSMIVNPDRNYDRHAGPRDSAAYQVRKPNATEQAVQRLIAAFQFTYPGAPTIYYGDEAGLWGGDDPDDRKPMLWPDLRYEPETYAALPGNHQVTTPQPVSFDRDLFAYYQKLAHIHRAHASLTNGDFTTMLTDNRRKLYIYKRRSGTDQVIVALNLSPTAVSLPLSPSLPAGTILTDELTGRTYPVVRGRVRLPLPARRALILSPTRSAR